MGDRQFPFSAAFGSNEGMMRYCVERIEQLGDAGHGNGATQPGIPCAEMFSYLWKVRQFYRRTVHRFQEEAVLGEGLGMFIEPPDCFSVEFDKRLVLELFSCFAKSCLRDQIPGHHCAREDFPELVEFWLVGAFDEVTEIEDERVKRQLSIVYKVRSVPSVAFDKTLRKDNFLYKFNQIGAGLGKHPPCQFSQDFQRNRS